MTNVPFTPLKDFFSEEFRSQYLVGLSYQARPEDEKLLELLPGWIKDGKVRLGVPDTVGESKIQGAGEVSGETQTISADDVGTLKL